MDIMTHAKFHFNRLMLTLIFGILASEPGEQLKKPGLIGLTVFISKSKSGHSSFRSLQFTLCVISKWCFVIQTIPLKGAAGLLWNFLP